MRKFELPPPPADVTRQTYDAWLRRRFGRDNPEEMTNPSWVWFVRDRLWPGRAADIMGASDSQDVFMSRARGAEPRWCFSRYGQSETRLPDGRRVFIGGEHEDFYDPDFCIYNDLTVITPGGEVEIFGYPRDVFPPTDFHAATLVGGRIAITGNLGYAGERHQGMTQVCFVSLENWAFEPIRLTADGPGWIHKHSSSLVDDDAAIVVRGGLIDTDDRLLRNSDDWRLDLASLTWECLVRRDWPTFEFRRTDEEGLHLFEASSAAFRRQYPDFRDDESEWEKSLDDPLRLDVYERLYEFDGCGRPFDAFDNSLVTCVVVDAVVARFEEQSGGLVATFEGRPSDTSLRRATEELRSRLAAIEQAEVEVRQVR